MENFMVQGIDPLKVLLTKLGNESYDNASKTLIAKLGSGAFIGKTVSDIAIPLLGKCVDFMKSQRLPMQIELVLMGVGALSLFGAHFITDPAKNKRRILLNTIGLICAVYTMYMTFYRFMKYDQLIIEIGQFGKNITALEPLVKQEVETFLSNLK